MTTFLKNLKHAPLPVTDCIPRLVQQHLRTTKSALQHGAIPNDVAVAALLVANQLVREASFPPATAAFILAMPSPDGHLHQAVVVVPKDQDQPLTPRQQSAVEARITELIEKIGPLLEGADAMEATAALCTLMIDGALQCGTNPDEIHCMVDEGIDHVPMGAPPNRR